LANTLDNLKTAFAGESQANRKYLNFADKADREGYPQIARLFRAAAEAETVHARNHLEAMDGIKSTKENLEAAVGGEHYEFTSMYPGFIAQAKTDKDTRAGTSFYRANEVEKVHHALYQQALKDLEAGKKGKTEPYYVCPLCGNTFLGEGPDKCPVCGALKASFKKIE